MNCVAWRSYRGGVWGWGVVLFAWLVFLAATLVISPIAGCSGAWSRLQTSARDSDATFAAITAVLGVIWSWFVRMDQMQRQKPNGDPPSS